MLVDQSGHRAIVMRLPALFALAALVGLSACDSAKVSELTGAKPAPTQIAAACPPAATAPACPPAQPAMAPEVAKPAPAAAPAPGAPQRIQSHAKARTWAQRRHVRQVKQTRQVVVKRHHAVQPPVRHFAYAGGYTGEASASPRGEAYVARHHERHYVHPPVYARPNEADVRQAYRYERRDDGYAQDNYRYERRESGHAPYVDERRDDGREAYRYERREGSVERGGSSYESGSSSSGYSSSGDVSGGGYGDDCNCRPQAAGRDRQGFLTWPGKR
jgi:uncharacterized membrane protein YgcG